MWRSSIRHVFSATTARNRVSAGVAISLAVPFSVRFFSAPSGRVAECTRWLMHEASPSAPRECPTPLVLLRTPRLTYPVKDAAAAEAENEEYRNWAEMFALRGYTAVEVDISVFPENATTPTEDGVVLESASGKDFPEPINSAKSALNDQLRLLNIPFAPVLIASGPAGLVAQAYVSDHRASGLVLIDPPADEDPRSGEKGWAWPAFTYEPRFPILLMPNNASVDQTRVGRAAADGVGRGGKGVSVVPTKDGPRGEKTRLEIERWMDRCGY